MGMNYTNTNSGLVGLSPIQTGFSDIGMVSRACDETETCINWGLGFIVR